MAPSGTTGRPFAPTRSIARIGAERVPRRGRETAAGPVPTGSRCGRSAPAARYRWGLGSRRGDRETGAWRRPAPCLPWWPPRPDAGHGDAARLRPRHGDGESASGAAPWPRRGVVAAAVANRAFSPRSSRSFIPTAAALDHCRIGDAPTERRRELARHHIGPRRRRGATEGRELPADVLAPVRDFDRSGQGSGRTEATPGRNRRSRPRLILSARGFALGQHQRFPAELAPTDIAASHLPVPLDDGPDRLPATLPRLVEDRRWGSAAGNSSPESIHHSSSCSNTTVHVSRGAFLEPTGLMHQGTSDEGTSGRGCGRTRSLDHGATDRSTEETRRLVTCYQVGDRCFPSRSRLVYAPADGDASALIARFHWTVEGFDRFAASSPFSASDRSRIASSLVSAGSASQARAVRAVRSRAAARQRVSGTTERDQPLGGEGCAIAAADRSTPRARLGGGTRSRCPSSRSVLKSGADVGEQLAPLRRLGVPIQPAVEPGHPEQRRKRLVRR